MRALWKNLRRNDVYNLLMMKAVNHVITIFGMTFLSLYFYGLSKGSMTPLAVYNLFFYIACVCVIFSVRNINKGMDKMRLVRAALILYAACFVAIGIMRESVIDYVWLMGLLFGTQHGLYYSAANPLEAEKIANKNRIKWLGAMMVVTGAINILFPLVFGSILTFAEYHKVSVIVAVFAVLGVRYAYRLKSESPNKGEKTNIKNFLVEMRKKENAPVRLFFWSYMFLGVTVCGGAMSAILTIISYNVFDTNLKLGAAASLFTVCSMLSGFMLGKFANDKNRNKFLSAAFCFLSPAILLVAFHATAASIIIFSVVNAFFFGIVSTLIGGQFFNFINHENIRDKYRIEYIVVIEIYLAAGRIAGYLLMIAAGVFASALLLRIILIGMVLSLFASVVLSCIVAKMLDKSEIPLKS